jgi:ABC-2 type transport system ATP-binding protein
MEEPIITARQLTVKKDKQTILDAIDLTVKKGTITGLIGPSGSGKTTLMRAIIGVQKITSGELTVLGAKAGNRSLRSQIGYVTQSPAIYPDLTVLQNLRYFARLVRATRTDVDIIVSTVQLQEQRNQLAGSLSGGQKARVSLAIALLGQPELLVLDEPTVGLDPLLRAELWDMFADLAKMGRTLLVSSHVMDEADRCDELILIRDGKILWNDSRQALMRETDRSNVGEAFIAMIQREAV